MSEDPPRTPEPRGRWDRPRRTATGRREPPEADQRRTRRRAPEPDAADRQYGESTRRRTRSLGLDGSAPDSDHWIDGGGRFGTAAHDPILGWYEPDAPTRELPIAEELARLRGAGTVEAPSRRTPDPPGRDPRSVSIPAPDRISSGPVSEQVPVVLPEAAPPEPEKPPVREPGSSQRSSFLVAAGIMLSRTAGLIREVAISSYLGTTVAADAFKAALRVPNLMQNLLGEGVLSASFIPVYAKLRADGDHETAGRVAAAVAGLLLTLTGVLSVVGVVFAEPITTVLVTGWRGERFDLTVELVRIMFPGVGFLVLSAWCLGVLNSHRKFFLSYVAPVLWNAAQVVALVTLALTGAGTRDLAVALGWGVLAGGGLQMLVQLPTVRLLLGRIRLSLRTRDPAVRTVLSRFVPVVTGRGVVQLLGYVDLWLASFLAAGAVSALTYGQVLYLLPISVFGMSVAAAELPDLSSVSVDDPDTRRDYRRRLEGGMARILFYVAPTATLFIVVGDVVARVLFQRGAIDAADTYAIWLVVAAFSLGLPATSASRLLQNALYGLGDARTPARLAAVRVVVAALVGLALMFPFDRLTIEAGEITGWGDMLALGPLDQEARQSTGGIPHLGIVGLSLGAATSAWLEYRLLSTALAWRIGRSHLGGTWLSPIAAGCVAMALVAFGCHQVFGDRHAIIAAALVLGPAGLTYLLVTRQLRVPEATATIDRVARLARRGRG